jgi:flagellar hook-associated protein 1 FlgK
MGIPSVMNTGRSGMVAAKAAIATTGHNITNANTDGFSRQRVETETATPQNGVGSRAQIGSGAKIARVSRLNDEYVEKQLRNANRDVSHFEEKEVVLRQTEDIFNEMNGDGLNRLVARFFNDFRKLANDPSNEAIRQSVRESASSMVNDFRRLRSQVDDVRNHIDSRLEGYTREVNQLTEEVRDLNIRIKSAEAAGASPNDLLDKRDVALKKLGSHLDLQTHKDNDGMVYVEVRGVGPLVAGPNAEKFDVFRTPADEQGKAENSFDIHTSAAAAPRITHALKGGKIGALLEVRDQTLSTVQNRLDELAFNLATAVNEVHRQGFTRSGAQGVDFFAMPTSKDRAAELLDLSSAVRDDAGNIASAAMPDAPGDNRVAIAISSLQNARLMNDGATSVDDFYNSIVSDIGIAASRNQSSLAQSKDIQGQLTKIRENVSGVSIDEETMNLLQYHQAYDASAKIIQVADECLKTVLDLRR